MSNTRSLSALIAILAVHASASYASPTFNNLPIVMNQSPDILLTAGVATNQIVNFQWFVTPMTGAINNGLFAKSNVPGLSIIATYGGGGPYAIGDIVPSGTWAPITTADGVYVPNYGPTHPALQHVPIGFDGSASAGTVSTIDLAVNIANDGMPSNFVKIGAINVFVTSPSPAWFTTVASTANLYAGRIVLDNGLSNGNPNQKIFITHVKNTGSPLDTHAASVEFVKKLGKWVIEHIDGTALTVGATYNVRIDPSAIVVITRDCGVLRGGCSRTQIINTPISNNNPYAIVFATPIGTTTYPVRAVYIAPYWYLTKQHDLIKGHAFFHSGEAYNVQVFGFGGFYTGFFSNLTFDNDDNGLAAEIMSASGALVNNWQYGQATMPLIVTPVDNPGYPYLGSPTNVAAFAGSPPLAVVYDSVLAGSIGASNYSRPGWQVVREDGGDTSGSYVNVWGPPH